MLNLAMVLPDGIRGDAFLICLVLLGEFLGNPFLVLDENYHIGEVLTCRKEDSDGNSTGMYHI